MKIGPDDAARVGAAVKAAEATTDAEVVVIVAARSDAYHDVGLHWAVLAMLLLMALVATVPGRFVALVDTTGGWGEAPAPTVLLTLLLAALALTFLVARLLFAWAPLRLALTPRATIARRVRRRAIEHFRAGIEARTASGTGVLLYLSLAEHRAELVADRAITASVPAETWGDTMAALVVAMRDGRPGDGIVAAIEGVGAILATRFPHTGTDPNELPDGLILL